LGGNGDGRLAECAVCRVRVGRAWRCAPNTNYRIFEAGARGLVILLAAIVLWQFVQGAQTAFAMLPKHGGIHLQYNAPDSE